MRIDLSWKFFIQRSQIVLLGAFCLINFLLILFSQDVWFGESFLHPAYANAPDGQRYWGAALNLIDVGRFAYSDNNGDLQLLVRGGPLPPIFFAAFIKVFGFSYAPYFFIPVQCILLYLIGLLSRYLAGVFGANKTLVQILLIFNPNLIGIAHHAQSEMMFSFVFTILLCLITYTIKNCSSRLPITAILIGLAAGLLPLIRPAAFFFVAALPFILYLAFTVELRNKQTATGHQHLRTIALMLLVCGLTLAPWSARNYLAFGTPGITLERSTVFRHNYETLLISSKFGSKKEVSDHIQVASLRLANERGFDKKCFPANHSEYTRPHCENQRTSVYLSLISKQPLSAIAGGLGVAWSLTYLAGGASALTGILNIPTMDKSLILDSHSGIKSFLFYFVVAKDKYPEYFIIFFLVTGFATLGRLTALAGLIALIKYRNKYRNLFSLNLFFLLAIGLFTSTFLFIGVSRFRAPLEPILMIYSAVGLQYLARFFNQMKSKQP